MLIDDRHSSPASLFWAAVLHCRCEGSLRARTARLRHGPVATGGLSYSAQRGLSSCATRKSKVLGRSADPARDGDIAGINGNKAGAIKRRMRSLGLNDLGKMGGIVQLAVAAFGANVALSASEIQVCRRFSRAYIQGAPWFFPSRSMWNRTPSHPWGGSDTGQARIRARDVVQSALCGASRGSDVSTHEYA